MSNITQASILNSQDNDVNEEHNIEDQNSNLSYESSLIPVKSNKKNDDTDNSSTHFIQTNDASQGKYIENVTNDSTQQNNDNAVLLKYKEACSVGDLKTVQELIESGIIEINHDYDNIDGISGLHLASVNNRLSVVKYLVTKKADVNYKCLNTLSTPLHWAARYGYVYIVDYLLKVGGADSTLVDSQGFNLLHLSVHSSNIMLVYYVLFFLVDPEYNHNHDLGKLDINAVDNNGRTALLWAAYQGDRLSVDALLKFNASTQIVDDQGFSPLHWATAKGQIKIINILIEYGSDVALQTNEGKNIMIIAEEMNTTIQLQQALYESGFDGNCLPLKKYFSKPKGAKMVVFITPTILVGCVFKAFSMMNFFLSLCVFVIPLLLITMKLLKSYVLPSFYLKKTFRKKKNSDQIIGYYSFQSMVLKTPFMLGVAGAIIFWILYCHLFKIIPYLNKKEGLLSHFLTSFQFLLFTITSTVLLIKLVYSDPGIIPYDEVNHEQSRQAIAELMKCGKYDSKNFSLETCIRKPLRCKYSGFHKKLIARFDHYCPWVYNDLGLFNHKLFIFFVISALLTGLSFYRVCMIYFDNLPDVEEELCRKHRIILLGDDDEFCNGFIHDKFTFNILVWILLNCIWVSILLFTQFMEQLKGTTTYEFIELKREMKRQEDNATNSYVNVFFETAPEELFKPSGNGEDEEDDTGLLPDIEQNGTSTNVLTTTMNASTRKLCFGPCLALIGLDQCIALLKRRRSHLLLPTNYGWKTNLKDFWLTTNLSAPIFQRIFSLHSSPPQMALLNGQIVDYFELYELPRHLDEYEV
ncbi:related to Palmitoyltransferase AKR1 [Saccharomycodes ludwigii]|uniref:Palmitoyltransferase n=1 Tax=Saccharomycodes ludwigii TaxID=36035 RepID=A0A376B7F6_9ASCO|nr:related to Palmitoyltransferase AKR1 [Saccharomycodes ludwigii]